MVSELLPAPRPRGTIDDQLVPLINIVFLLLVFFMVAGRITPQLETSVEPPVSASRKPSPDEPALLVLQPGGTLLLAGRPIGVPDLAHVLTPGRNAADVTLAADRAVLAAELAPVLHELRLAGFERVTLYARRGRAH